MTTQTISSRLANYKAAVRSTGLFALLTLGAVFAQQANAGCLQYDPPKKTASWETPGSFFGAAKFQRADYRKDGEEEYGPSFFRPEITGLWAFKYISKGNASKPFPITIPDGAPVDGGNTIWFADGNEITYSGMRDPSTGAVCLGVWKQTGERTYELNHIGLSWNPPGNAEGAPVGPGGPAFIKQYVTLNKDGNSYTGTFTITQLGPDGKTLALPGVITGTIEATRVTVNTTTQAP
jgi:hypothetical protein